jgi:hypothetical protein
MENIIWKLFDEQYVLEMFKKRLLPLYPQFKAIKKISISSKKKNIWQTTYHVVIEYKIKFLDIEGKIQKKAIYCSAHSEEPRKNVYHALKYLWERGFAKDYLTIPRPLFYSDRFKAVFYRGLQGNNLYHYIRNQDFKMLDEFIPRAAAWFAKLHRLPLDNAYNFNKDNSRIKTVFPGKKHVFESIAYHYPEYLSFYQRAYNQFIKNEENFLAQSKKRWIVHGDAHPENIIKIGKKKIGVIDYTDICLSDFARDLGCFLQQFDYMLFRKVGDEAYAEKMKQIFLDNYYKNAKIKSSPDLDFRIDNYYNWTTIRTATFFLLKYDPEPERAEPLIRFLRTKLGIE